jgi:hypothetical protein
LKVTTVTEDANKGIGQGVVNFLKIIFHFKKFVQETEKLQNSHPRNYNKCRELRCDA